MTTKKTGFKIYVFKTACVHFTDNQYIRRALPSPGRQGFHGERRCKILKIKPFFFKYRLKLYVTVLL